MPKAKPYNATKGFIPSDPEGKAVSKALEFACDDWTIATLANSMGRADGAAEYAKRGGYYSRYFDRAVGFMRGKNADGVAVKSPFVSYADIMAGKELVFKMGREKAVFWK